MRRSGDEWHYSTSDARPAFQTSIHHGNVMLLNMNESGVDVELASSETNAMTSSASTMNDFQKGWRTLYDRLSDIHTPDLLSLLSCNGLLPRGALLSRVNALSVATNVMFVGVPPPCPVCCSSLRIELLQWKCSGRTSEGTECAGPQNAVHCTKPELPENFGAPQFDFDFDFTPHLLPVFSDAEAVFRMPADAEEEADLTKEEYKAEYAKSGRSSCKKCSKAIPDGALRIGPLVQSPHFDGKVPLWHHFECLATEAVALIDAAQVDGYFGLRPEHQTQIDDLIAANRNPKAAVKEDKKAATNAPFVALPEVFSESGLDVEYHRVATDPLSSKPLTATLHKSEQNSFYKLQVVVSDPPSLSSATASTNPKPQKFYFVRVWGRVGFEGIGGSQACI
jgi:hypothetical protein